MAAPPLSNDFNGGADGVAITLANSDDGGGDAFQQVNGAPLYSTDVLVDGFPMMEVVDAVSNKSVAWFSFGALQVPIFTRGYVWLSGLPGTSEQTIFLPITSTGGTVALVSLTTGATPGRLKSVIFGAGTAGPGSVTVPTGALFRVEAKLQVDADSCEQIVRFWENPQEAGAPTDEISLATGVPSNTHIDRMIFGTHNTFPAAPHTARFGRWKVSLDGWIGPANKAEIAQVGVFDPHIRPEAWL